MLCKFYDEEMTDIIIISNDNAQHWRPAPVCDKRINSKEKQTAKQQIPPILILVTFQR